MIKKSLFAGIKLKDDDIESIYRIDIDEKARYKKYWFDYSDSLLSSKKMLEFRTHLMNDLQYIGKMNLKNDDGVMLNITGMYSSYSFHKPNALLIENQTWVNLRDQCVNKRSVLVFIKHVLRILDKKSMNLLKQLQSKNNHQNPIKNKKIDKLKEQISRSSNRIFQLKNKLRSHEEKEKNHEKLIKANKQMKKTIENMREQLQEKDKQLRNSKIMKETDEKIIENLEETLKEKDDQYNKLLKNEINTMNEIRNELKSHKRESNQLKNELKHKNEQYESLKSEHLTSINNQKLSKITSNNKIEELEKEVNLWKIKNIFLNTDFTKMQEKSIKLQQELDELKKQHHVEHGRITSPTIEPIEFDWNESKKKEEVQSPSLFTPTIQSKKSAFDIKTIIEPFQEEFNQMPSIEEPKISDIPTIEEPKINDMPTIEEPEFNQETKNKKSKKRKRKTKDNIVNGYKKVYRKLPERNNKIYSLRNNKN